MAAVEATGIARGYASRVTAFSREWLTTSGDAQGAGTDYILLSGDQQSGTDAVLVSEDADISFGISDGAAIASGYLQATGFMVGNTAGVATVSGVGQAIANDGSAVGTATGTATVSGVLAATASFDGTAAGIATASAISVGPAIGSASGIAAATAFSQWTASAVGTAAGVATAIAVSPPLGGQDIRLSGRHEPNIQLTGSHQGTIRLSAIHYSSVGLAASTRAA